MISESLHFRLTTEELVQLKQFAQQNGYNSLQDLFHEYIRHCLHVPKHNGGKPSKDSKDDFFLKKFATPTQETEALREKWHKQGFED